MEKKVLLSVRDLHVKFRVRDRILTAIRGISLDIYDGESIAIVGESGSGKSVFTKTFAGMLETNGFISNGDIYFDDEELAKTSVKKTPFVNKLIADSEKKLNEYSKFEAGASIYKEIQELKKEKEKRENLTEEEREQTTNAIADLLYKKTELFNYKQTLDRKTEKAEIDATQAKIKDFENQIKSLKEQEALKLKEHKQKVAHDTAYLESYKKRLEDLERKYALVTSNEISDAQKKRNNILAKEMYLSVGRYGLFQRLKLLKDLRKSLKQAMIEGRDLNDDVVRNDVFDDVAFRVRYESETATDTGKYVREEFIYGTVLLNLAKVRYDKDWAKIRGARIATVFQDPMTSLNPIITIGKQISSIIMKHQGCSEVEARARAIEMMGKVGIPNPENRYDDYPFQYSGGMRQRIVIAIALSCQPKILICDEPTTALDVTIQAQILELLKDLQKEFGFTIVFITHDLGVVANVADRVAVMYAGQIIEVGTAEDVFFDPRHPYTWALLSSLPQLAKRNTKLFSISGTPPSLYNKIIGDPFAPRNAYCLKVDTLKEPPMFKVSDTHYAKTWLLDPRAPKYEKPEAIHNIHEKLIEAFNI